MKIQEIIEKAKEIEIVSGEGEQGTIEQYEGKRTVKALKMRLKKEECQGDRWSYCNIDGVRYNYSDL